MRSNPHDYDLSGLTLIGTSISDHPEGSAIAGIRDLLTREWAARQRHSGHKWHVPEAAAEQIDGQYSQPASLRLPRRDACDQPNTSCRSRASALCANL